MDSPVVNICRQSWVALGSIKAAVIVATVWPYGADSGGTVHFNLWQ